MDFRNATQLNSACLERLIRRHTHPYRHDDLVVRVRYSRGALFSGTCYYAEARIFVNLGRHAEFPLRLGTHIARSQSNRSHWWREVYRLEVVDAYQLALFVYLHELYHYLVNMAGKNPRRKEAMCDRFATRVLVDEYGARVLSSTGRRIPRKEWDIQDLDAFVAAAPREAPADEVLRPIPVVVHGLRSSARRKRGPKP
jgi:hypothetical protein